MRSSVGGERSDAGNGTRLSGDTRLFPVIGDPIAQVRSPSVLTPLLADWGINAIVVPMHIGAADIPSSMKAFERVRNVDGVLVTIPHKIAVLTLCTEVTDRASFAGSVNVVRKTGHGWCGDNTDGLGYLDGLSELGFAAAGCTALLVGCGGAGSAIAYEILARDARLLALHDIDTERRDALLHRLDERFPGRVKIGSQDPTGYDLVANATPMGMRPDDPLPVDAERLLPEQFVACVVTRPLVPPLIEAARRIGCRTMTGADMFDAQAEALLGFLLAGTNSSEVPTGGKTIATR